MIGKLKQTTKETNDVIQLEISQGMWQCEEQVGSLKWLFHNGEEEVVAYLQWDQDFIMIKEVGSTMNLYLELPVNDQGEGYLKTLAGMILFQTELIDFSVTTNDNDFKLMLEYRLISETETLTQCLEIQLS